MWCENQNGKAKYIERYKDPLTLKLKRVSVTFDKDTPQNRKKAAAELARRIDEICCLTVRENVTLRTVYDAYIAHQEVTLKMSTARRNQSTLNTVINIIGDDIIIDKLTAQHVNQALLATGAQPGTLNEYLRRFKAMLNWAYKNDFHENIKLVTKLESFNDVSHSVKIKDKYLEPEELEKLLTYMLDTEAYDWYYLTSFLALSGLRVGEALALEDGDIDYYIHVTKNYNYIDDVTTSTKTENSTRDVYVQPELAELIKKIRRYRKELMLYYGVKCPLFFFNGKGEHISYGAYNKYLREASERLLGRRTTIHALRHTHASLLMAQGVSIDTISRRLGHENSSITKEIYLHVTKKLIEADNEQLKNIKLL